MKVVNRNGFSMIEVLVAATILVVVVMMLGALFQQTSTAWRIGLMRTGGYAQIRTYIGTFQRDASAMINANLLPKSLLYNNEEQNFGATEVRFYTMTGSDKMRSLNYIIYDTGGRRTYRTLKLDQGNASGNAVWDDEETSNLLEFLPNASGENLLVSLPGFQVNFPDETEYNRDGQTVSPPHKFPLYLTIDAKINQSGSLYDVGAESAGPDRVWNTKDDIRTFVKP